MKKYLPVLKHCPFFAGMDEGEILSILNCVDAKIRTFDHDEYIFRAGDSTASMGLILSGSVLVIQEDLWGAPEYHVQNRSRRLLCGTLRRNARFRFEHQRGNRRPLRDPDAEYQPPFDRLSHCLHPSQPPDSESGFRPCGKGTAIQ